MIISILRRLPFLILFLTLFSLTSLSSQNLVLNPGFEDFKCDRWYNSSIEICDNWSSPNLNSPDYFTNSCPGYIVASVFPNIWWGYQLPAGGDAFAGLIAYRPEEGSEYLSSATEYLQGTLSEVLTKDFHYTFQLNISLSESSSLSLQNLGVFFSDKKTDTRKVKLLSFKSDFLIAITNDTSKWITIHKSFIANGYEKYFIIGTFVNEIEPKTKKVHPSKEITLPRTEAYYFIDDVSITALETNNESEDLFGKPSLMETEAEIIKRPMRFDSIIQTETPVILDAISFESNKSQLLENSFSQLNELVLLLTENINYNIEINGYTDDRGKEGDNLTLSQNRATAVAVYLKEKGISAMRISSKGFGAKDFIESNLTEKGRATTRRVTFTLLKK